MRGAAHYITGAGAVRMQPAIGSGALTACASLLVEKRGERSARDKARRKKMRRGGEGGGGRKKEKKKERKKS